MSIHRRSSEHVSTGDLSTSLEERTPNHQDQELQQLVHMLNHEFRTPLQTMVSLLDMRDGMPRDLPKPLAPLFEHLVDTANHTTHGTATVDKRQYLTPSALWQRMAILCELSDQEPPLCRSDVTEETGIPALPVVGCFLHLLRRFPDWLQQTQFHVTGESADRVRVRIQLPKAINSSQIRHIKHHLKLYQAFSHNIVFLEEHALIQWFAPTQCLGREAEASAPATTAREASHTPQHILYAEDDQMTRRMTGRLLERAGYRVTYVEDGLRAVETYQQCHEEDDLPDLLLFDNQMPGMNGIDALKAIQSEYGRLPPSLMVTGDAHNQATFSEVFDAVCIKPVRPHVLKTTIASVLARRGHSGLADRLHRYHHHADSSRTEPTTPLSEGVRISVDETPSPRRHHERCCRLIKLVERTVSDIVPLIQLIHRRYQEHPTLQTDLKAIVQRLSNTGNILSEYFRALSNVSKETKQAIDVHELLRSTFPDVDIRMDGFSDGITTIEHQRAVLVRAMTALQGYLVTISPRYTLSAHLVADEVIIELMWTPSAHTLSRLDSALKLYKPATRGDHVARPPQHFQLAVAMAMLRWSGGHIETVETEGACMLKLVIPRSFKPELTSGSVLPGRDGGCGGGDGHGEANCFGVVPVSSGSLYGEARTANPPRGSGTQVGSEAPTSSISARGREVGGGSLVIRPGAAVGQRRTIRRYAVHVEPAQHTSDPRASTSPDVMEAQTPRPSQRACCTTM